MNLNKIDGKLFGAVLTLSAILSACGGGGGDASGGTATTVATTTTTTVQASSIVSVVSPANYAAATDTRTAYDYLNAQRQACGFGLLEQSAKLDTATQAHSDYMLTNGMSLGHSEDPVKAGYTGTTPAARATAAAYAYLNLAEVIVAVGTDYGSGSFGAANIMNLFLAPYHGMAMLGSYREIGVGAVTTAGVPAFHITTVNFGTTATKTAQLLASNQVATYPCGGTTGVLSKSYVDESPAPIPGRNLNSAPIGHPIYIKVRDGQTLVLISSDLREFGASISETLISLNKATDTNGQFIDNSEIILMPNVPLKINTSYRFQATGTNNGQAFSVDFTFTTSAF